MNIKLSPNSWTSKKIPLTLIKHRLLPSDPTYKFIFYGVIHARSNIAIRRDSEDNNYYDIDNMSVLSDRIVTGSQWLAYINKTFNLFIVPGESYQSEVFPELFFVLESEKELFDDLYNSLKDQNILLSEGVNVLIDFSIKLPGGFIRNKLGVDTDNIENWILSDISFSILKLMMRLDENENFKIKEEFKSVYNLNKQDIEIIESAFTKYSNIYPIDENNINILWQHLYRYISLDTLAEKSSLFNFNYGPAIVSEINTKDVSLVLNSKNRPMYIQTQMKFDSASNRVYITRSGPSIPVSTSIGFPRKSVLTRDTNIPPAKNINTKINNHIYMVNKK